MSLYAKRDASPKPKALSKEIKFAASQAILTGVKTVIPGLVEMYDAETKRAVIQPIIKQGFRNGSSAPRAPLIDVPLLQPSTGGYMVHLPIVEGDIVAVLFTQSGLATFKRDWMSGMQPVEPVPSSAYTDAVAMPWGVHSIRPVTSEGVCIQSADGSTYFTLTDGRIELRVGSRYLIMDKNRGRYG